MAAPVVAAAIGAFYLPFHLADRRRDRQVVTPEHKEALVTEKLAEGYRKEGHGDPWRAAHEHKSNLRHIERFRIYACEQFVAGRDIDDIRGDWWKRNRKGIEECMATGADRSAGLRCAAVVRDSIMDMPEDEVFSHHPAASAKWQEHKRRLDEEAARVVRSTKRDPVHESIIEQLWENRNSSKRLMGT